MIFIMWHQASFSVKMSENLIKQLIQKCKREVPMSKAKKISAWVFLLLSGIIFMGANSCPLSSSSTTDDNTTTEQIDYSQVFNGPCNYSGGTPDINTTYDYNTLYTIFEQGTQQGGGTSETMMTALNCLCEKAYDAGERTCITVASVCNYGQVCGYPDCPGDSGGSSVCNSTEVEECHTLDETSCDNSYMKIYQNNDQSSGVYDYHNCYWDASQQDPDCPECTGCWVYGSGYGDRTCELSQ